MSSILAQRAAEAARAARAPAPLPTPARDMDASPFSEILADVVRRVPGAFAAALVDEEGETVDYTGELDPFDVKVAAAHWRVILAQLEQIPLFDGVRVLAVRGSTRGVLLRTLPERYALALVLRRRAGFSRTERPLSHAEQAIAREAGWRTQRTSATWFAVSVTCDERGRPMHIVYGGLEESVEVLGTLMGLRRREAGYRVRLASGPEVTLVREPGGFWYVEEGV